jgi:hypothetical protein
MTGIFVVLTKRLEVDLVGLCQYMFCITVPLKTTRRIGFVRSTAIYTPAITEWQATMLTS